MTTQNVQTNGFVAQPAAPANLAQPQVPEVRLNSSDGNGVPHQYPNQVPGFPVVQPVQGQPPAAQPAQQVLTQADITALITNALSQGQPAAAPNQAAQPVANSERPTWLKDSIATFDVSSIDDPIIKSMAEVLQLGGKDLDLDRVLGNALAKGDASLVDVAYLAEKGGPQAQQLASIAKGIVNAVNAKSESITTEVHALVGGEANWNQASSVFNSAAPQELKVVVATMLDSTDEKQIKAAAKIVAEFSKTSGHLPQAGAALLNSESAGVLGQGLSKAQFQAELGKLTKDTPTYESEREALFVRRSLGKRGGL